MLVDPMMTILIQSYPRLHRASKMTKLKRMRLDIDLFDTLMKILDQTKFIQNGSCAGLGLTSDASK